MRVTEPKARASVPSVPVASLVGHDGPVQAVQFTGKNKKKPFDNRMRPLMKDISRAWTEWPLLHVKESLTTTEVSYSFTLT